MGNKAISTENISEVPVMPMICDILRILIDWAAILVHSGGHYLSSVHGFHLIRFVTKSGRIR
jgi:hypothetical protein